MEDSQAAPASIYSHALKFGIILGIISIVCVIAIYAIDFTFLASFKFLGLIMVIGLGVVIYAGINYRSEIGGYMPYGKAFIHGFAVLAISGIIGTIFNIVLYTIIDPELAQKMTDTIVENTEQMMRNFGAPDSSIDQTTEKMRAEMPENFSTGGLAYGYVKALIWYGIIALITSLFVRKNVPVEM